MEIESVISVVLFFLFTIGWKVYDHLKKLYQNQNMFKKVGWIVEKEHNLICYSNSVSLRTYDLLSYILEEQVNLNINKEFCIDSSNDIEKNIAEEILALHRNDIIKSYFSDFLTTSKKICKLNSLEYYFNSLHNFLGKESEKSSSLNNKIYQFKDLKGSYSYYELTDFGRVFYKLNLIALIFVETNENTMKLYEYINPNQKEWFMDYLKNNEVSFWHYR